MSHISIQGLKKSFGSKVVLKNVSLNVNKGESLVIMGGSGTGKSVLIKCILGLLKYNHGVIKIDGKTVPKANSFDPKISLQKYGMLFQGSALFDSLSVWQNICFAALQEKRMTEKQAIDRAVEVLHSVNLGPDVARLFPAELSGGMQRRVALARAIVDRPEIIFFDEPTAGLDPIVSSTINELIVKSAKELGATTITITHDMASAKRISDHVAMIHQGEIIWYGTSKELSETDNPFVHQFINGLSAGPIQAV